MTFAAFSVLVILSVIIFVRCSFCIVKVISTSMFPTLNDGDRVLVFLHYPTKWLRKGQIVIVWHTPSDLSIGKWPKSSRITPYIKRVAGLSGDVIVTEFNRLNIALRKEYYQKINCPGKKIHLIPEGFIFVESDNPAGGYDSHSWGPIPMRGVLGIAIIKISNFRYQ